MKTPPQELARLRARRAERLARGRCPRCEPPLPPTRRLCARGLAAQREATRRWRIAHGATARPRKPAPDPAEAERRSLLDILPTGQNKIGQTSISHRPARGFQ